jgi:ATP-binding cassette, subfamily F, member 3
MLELNKISLSQGAKTLLKEASVRIERNYRVGLFGRNGAGKTSLLNMLLGRVTEDSGSFNCVVKQDDIVHLQQTLPNTDLSALEYAKGGDKDWFVINHDLMKAEAQEDGILIAECHVKLASIDGYSLESRAAKILKGLGFKNQELNLPVASFSGGWQMRLQLARVLLSRGQLLLLDEPTNHLDINAIMWLENWLLKSPKTIIIISHDRDFLDGVCTHTLHLSNLQLKLYTGNYSSFSKQYSLQLEVQARQSEKLAAKKAHMQSFVDRFRAKASKAKQAQSRVKALEKLTDTSALVQESPFSFNFLSSDALTGCLMNFNGAAGYSDCTVIDTCRLNINFGDRIGLIGQNGQGKTTLLKTLAQELAPVKGGVDCHPKLKLGYFSQHQLDMLDLDTTPLDSLLAVDKTMPESMARKFLGGFDFCGNRVFEPVRNFSGGEKARLALAILIYQRPNCLLLDEPTNHLDMQMREAFICALQNFEGAMILVSHDRYFMSSVVDEVWCVIDGGVNRYSGDLADYKKFVLRDEVVINEKPSAVNKSKTITEHSSKIKKLSSKSLQRLEKRIEKVTAKIASLEQELADSKLYETEYSNQIDDKVREHREAKEKLEFLEQQWLSEQD